MNFQKLFVPIGGVIIVAAAYQGYGWPGVVLMGGGIVMWVLLNFTRMMKVMQRASARPIGYVDSAVMLNAKLKAGMTLLHVVAMTRAPGALRSPKDTQPEIYRWSDTTDSHVTCEFNGGKLQKWEMFRPAPVEDAPASHPMAESASSRVSDAP
jgi:hypothetical protein